MPRKGVRQVARDPEAERVSCRGETRSTGKKGVSSCRAFVESEGEVRESESVRLAGGPVHRV